nr:unnamed protein product [Callosobruchus chinensis]
MSDTSGPSPMGPSNTGEQIVTSENGGCEENNAPPPKKRQLNLDDLFPVKKIATGYIPTLKEKADDLTSSGQSCTKLCAYCKLEELMNPKWKAYLQTEFEKDYFKNIKTYLHNKNHLPPIGKIFTFTQFFPLEETKVVIVGQDPYHNDKQAMGLAFSVPIGIPIPPSLTNVFREIASDFPGFEIPQHGDLTNWAKNGVLLLNTVLTVAKNQPNSHSEIGWKIFTNKILELVNEKCEHVVFMLWGYQARCKSQLIDRNKHLVLCCGHPSPYSEHLFLGCGHFSDANQYLEDHGKMPIKW